MRMPKRHQSFWRPNPLVSILARMTLLVALCSTGVARAQAPVVANSSLATVAGVAPYVVFSDITTWTGNVYTLTYSIVKPPANGVITFPGAPSYTYYCTYTCTNLSFVGPDPFTWKAASGGQVSGVATCAVAVVAPVAPTATSFTVAAPYVAPGIGFSSYNFGSFVTIPGADSGLPTSYSFVTWPTNGTISFPYGSSTPVLAYTPNPGFVGQDRFLWNVVVGPMTSATASCTILVPANTPPTAQACSFSTPSGVMAMNGMPYTDPDSGQTYTAVVISQPANGTACLDPYSGGIYLDYCPAPNFAGTDTFSFAISDGMSISAPAVCSMIVTPGPPAAQNQTVVMLKNGSFSNINLSYVGGGGYTFWPVLKGGPFWNGTLTTNGNIFSYKAATNAMGPVTFKWNMAYSNSVSGLFTNGPTGTCTIVMQDMRSNTNCDWLQWRFDECRTALSPQVLSNKLYLQWQRALPVVPGAFDTLGVNDTDLCRPVQMGKQLFVPLLANDSVSAYHTDTGAQNWRYYAGGALRRPAAAAALPNGTNVVIFGCDDGQIYCLNAADGTELWRYRLAPNSKKAMAHKRLASCWPVWGSPVIYSNRVYAVAGILSAWNLFGCCLDAATGAVIWHSDGDMWRGNNCLTSFGPICFSTDHSTIYGTTLSQKNAYAWKISPLDGHFIANYGLGSAGHHAAPWINWYIDGAGNQSPSYPMPSYQPGSTCEPLIITAGDQMLTPATALSLGVQGTVGTMLAGDHKLFITTTNGLLYCFGGTNVAAPASYARPTIVPLPSVADAWTTVVQGMLTNRPDLQQGLAEIWGVGSGRLVEELAKQAPNMEIVACDPDPAKLHALRMEMDAAGWSGAHVSTVLGNPVECGFAPYQATLIASEDICVASGSAASIPAFVKKLYKCTRPFSGEIWLPTTSSQNAALASGLAALNLPTCGGSASYAVFNRTDMSIPGGNNVTQIRRLGFPDANQTMKPPFRLIALDAQNTTWYPSTSSLNPSFGSGFGGQVAQGVVGNPGYDLYNWLPARVLPAGYAPAPTNNNTAVPGVDRGRVHLPLAAATANPLFSRTERKGYSYPLPTPSFAYVYANCGGFFAYGNTFYNTGKIIAMGDSVNYWGVLPLIDIGGCNTIEVGINNGMAILAPGNVCTCNQNEQLTEFGFVPDDDLNEEQWVMYSWGSTTRTVQETPMQNIGINFGAPGDRWDDLDGVLWTHHPWLSWLGSLPTEPYPLVPVTYSGACVSNRYHYSGLFSPGTSHAWVSGSYVVGMSGITIPLAQPLVAQRAITPPVMDGSLTDVCWSSASQVNLFTSCDMTTNGILDYCKVSYDATNLYVAGVLHQVGPRPLDSSHNPWPAYMKVALGERGRASSVNQIVQIYLGDPQFAKSGGVYSGADALPGRQSIGIPTNAWMGGYATNKEMFAGEIGIPWSALASAGLWTSQLVMNVEICGRILNGSGLDAWGAASGNLTNVCTASVNADPDLPKYFSPLYLDAARGPVAQVIPHTVKLFFAEMEGLTNGQRVFDVQLQGQTVLTNFDVYAAAGGTGCCEVIREFDNVGIASALNIGFVAHAGQPILGGVEILTNGITTANQPPVARLDASALSGPAPLDVQFSAQRSFDPDGQIVECAWDTGDGRLARGSLLHHVFTEPGTYQVCLLVTDNSGATSSTFVPVTVSAGAPAAFVVNIRSNKAPNCDYSSFEAWNNAGAALPCDLTSSTMVFNVSSTGTYTSADNLTALTFTGGNTGILRYVASWVTNAVTNCYVAVANVGGTGTVMSGTITAKSGHTLTISDTGVLSASLLFAVSATNTCAAADDGQPVVFTGGGMGVLRHINHAAPQLALISECRGLIQPGTVTCATGHTFAVSDAGHPVGTVIANCYNDWTNGLHYSGAITLSGAWITDPNHCLVIRASPGQGHTGKIRGSGGNYSGFTLTVPLTAVPNTRISQTTLDANTLTVVSGCSVSRVLGSVVVSGNGVTVANSMGPVFNTGTSQDITFHNCTGGSFQLSDINARRIRAVNCLAYSNSAGFTTTPTNEVWLNHCVSLDGSASVADSWQDGNIGNQARQIVSFVSAGNDYHLAGTDTGAHGQGQPGLGADIDGNLRTGLVYDAGAAQVTNALTAFQQWQLQYYGSLSATGAASNQVNGAGLSNWQMFRAGSNPNDPNTWFRITAITPSAGNKLGLNFNTVSGMQYIVSWKTNLVDGLGWQFYTNIDGVGGAANILFSNALPNVYFQIQAQ